MAADPFSPVCPVRPGLLPEPILKHPAVTHLQLLEVGGRLPVFVVADAGAAREANGDPICGVGFGFGELGPGDLPHWGFLNTAERKSRHVPAHSVN